MKKWQREIIERLYSVQNKIGAVGDLTAINIKTLVAYKQANLQASMVLAAAFFEENKEKADMLLKEIELLSCWNFPDKNGRLSAYEKKLNEELEKTAKDNGIKFFFNR